MPRLDIPYIPRLLVPGQGNGIPILPDPRTPAHDAWRVFMAREDWLWAHHRNPQTKAFLAPMRGGAVGLVAASNEDVYWSIAPITARPITLGGWAYRTADHTGVMLSFGTAAGNNYYSIRHRAEGVAKFNVQTWNGTGVVDLNSGVTIADATWYQVTSASNSATDRDLWIDGAGGVNSTTDDGVTPSTWDQVKTGRHSFTGSNQPFNGRAAELFAYGIDDDATIAAALATGAHPFMIGASLKFYAPMLRDETAGQWHEYFSAASSSESATPDIVNHPPVMQPGALVQVGVPSAVGGVTTRRYTLSTMGVG